jgi:hypothetical protein
VQDFGGIGILIGPTSGTVSAVITNTILSNVNYGVFYAPHSGSPVVNIVIDHVVATNNVNIGFHFDGSGTSGALDVSISNSISSQNNEGIFAGFGNSLRILIDNTEVSGNTVAGIQASPPAIVGLSRSVIKANGDGIENFVSTFYTYGNDLIDFNGLNITAPLNTAVTLR